MEVLYLASEQGYSGVSAFCIGLGVKLKKEGYKVGYMKPLGYMPVREDDLTTDVDAAFMWELLELGEPLRHAAPVVLTASRVEAALKGKRQDYAALLKRSFEAVSPGKDVFIMEGALNLHQGALLGISGFTVSELFQASVLLLERFDEPFSETNVVDKVLCAKCRLGSRLKGVVINIVPSKRLEYVKDFIVPYLEEKGVPVLGAIRRLPILRSISIGRLAEGLGGQVLCARNKLDELVEGVMVGAMGAEHALEYFRRKPNLAVVTGGDRADVQVAALESRSKCLILTGNFRPSAVVLGEAEDLGIPMILVEYDSMTTAERAHWLIGHARTHEPQKLERLSGILDEYVDMDALYKLMKLKKRT